MKGHASQEHAQDGRGVKHVARRAKEFLGCLAARRRALCASEHELALYAAGDLDERTAPRVARHVGQCEACSASAAKIQRSREILIAAAEQPSPSDLLEVRQRVMSRIAGEPSRRFRWAWAFALSFGILVIALWMRPGSHSLAVNLPTSPLPLALQLPARELIVRARHITHRPHDRAGIRDVALIQGNKGGEMIRLQTADPNIVILLEAERTEAE